MFSTIVENRHATVFVADRTRQKLGRGNVLCKQRGCGRASVPSRVADLGEDHSLATVTKKNLAAIVAQRIGCSTSASIVLIDAVFRAMVRTLVDNYDRIEARGFGSLTVLQVNARQGARNPRTGEPVSVPPRRKVRFRPAAPIREALSIWVLISYLFFWCVWLWCLVGRHQVGPRKREKPPRIGVPRGHFQL